MTQEKRSSVTLLTKPVKRLVEVDLAATETEPALQADLVLGLDPEKGVTIRTKGRRRELTVSVEDLIAVATGDTVRKSPKNRLFLLGK